MMASKSWRCADKSCGRPGADKAHQVQVTALDPVDSDVQLELFDTTHEAHDQINAVMDTVNRRYGELALAPARLLNRSSMPNVIAPAWKPFGHRKTI
jgi:DNA polymerase-4